MGGWPLVCTGHGGPPAGLADAAGVAFAAAAAGDAEAGGAFGAGLAGGFCVGEPGDAAGDPAAPGEEAVVEYRIVPKKKKVKFIIGEKPV